MNVAAHFRFHARRAGLPAAIGAGLLVFAGAIHVTALASARHELARLELEAQSLQARIKQAAASLSGAPDNPEEQLAAFYAFFPGNGSLPDWLDKLYAAAKAEGLALEQGEYRVGHEQQAGLVHYQITLPLKGTYPQLRRFLGAALVAVPIASLDDVRFTKQSVGQAAIEAKVKLTLYLREGA